MNRRGQIGPQGVLLMLAGTGGIAAVSPSMASEIRELQRREEERLRDQHLRRQGIDPERYRAELRLQEAGLSKFLPPNAAFPRDVLDQVERLLHEPVRRIVPPNPNQPALLLDVRTPPQQGTSRSLAERKARRAKRKQRRRS